MITIYIVGLPKNYIERYIAFTTQEKAQEMCDALQKENPCGASSGFFFEVFPMKVYEDTDIQEGE